MYWLWSFLITYNSFSGSFQEIRYYTKPISESVFKDYVMNPSSIEGNSLNSGADQLAFRLPLGGELYTGSISIHPKVTGSWITTSSFASNSTAFFNSTPTFVPNTEYFYYDQPVAGIKNAIADKIRVENNVIPEGDVLSPFMSLSQQANISQSYTANTNLLEVAFSPQDEVNDDINSSLGFFNIGEYIGDPRLRSSSAESYPDLNALRDSYFQKYTKNYNLVDFFRLIKFFDNSLFKMIKDFVPARTSLASGIIIKQHILERNKFPQPQVDTNSIIAKYAKSGSIIWNEPIITKDLTISGTIAPQWNDYNAGTVENPNGGTAGVFEMFNGVNSSPYGPNGTGPENIFNLTQSWNELIQIASGSVNVIHNSQDEFYNGEFEGSTLTITTQSLNPPFPNDVIDFSYTPVRYSQFGYGFLNDLSNDPNPPFAESQFLNELTVPAPGEILLLTPWFQLGGMTPGGAWFSNQSGPIYVKIHKFDNNGVNNDIALGQATKLRIKYTTLSDYVTIGNIIDRTEYPTYWLYKVQSLGSNTADNYIKDYSVSASRISPPIVIPIGDSLAISSLTESIDNLGYFDPDSGVITFQNTPNIPIYFSASLNLNSSGNANTSSLALIKNGDITDEYAGTSVSSTFFILNSGANTVVVTGSFYPLAGDNFYLRLFNDGNPYDTSTTTFNSIQLKFTQSMASGEIPYVPSSPEYDSVIIEPYITEPNFYNSDDNALLNSVNEQRESTFALDVDYSDGITPINFALLITGSATPATVPDSNYTSKKSTILKYEGSKSTSQLLNTWSPPGTIEGGYEDIGTYGKLPTVESLKTYIAYCDWIGGWPPEYENASAVNVVYLIKADGTVVIPNTSKDSLSIMQQTFQTGERVIINTKNINVSPLDPYRTVIRGGAHLEPILYSQFGNLPNVTFNTTMSFEDIVLSPNGNVGNYVATFNKTSNQTGTLANAETLITFDSAVYGAPFLASNGYQVNATTIEDGVNLTFTATLNVETLFSITPGLPLFQFYGIGIKVLLYNTTTNTLVDSQLLENENDIGAGSMVNYTFTANNSDLQPGIYNIYIEVYNAGNYGPPTTITIKSSNTSFNVSQYPIFTQPITSSGANSIWNWPDAPSYPYIITSSNSTLVELYGNLNAKAKDISGSGFNPIQLPWKINYGDEFKFEGREDWSYMVKNIYAPEESGSGRIFETGSIEVHFNANLPVSASSSVFNLDHFLIRRYVDDAGQNIITGFRPPGSEGPYLVKPEFVVPELNKSIDEVILDLTQKGLIT
jgi:hypothetical protein